MLAKQLYEDPPSHHIPVHAFLHPSKLPFVEASKEEELGEDQIATIVVDPEDLDRLRVVF
jgi:hypothetical protein